MIIGAQLYGAREFTKTLEDFSETLKKVADIGYTAVQVSGTCAYEGEWLAEELKKNGLVCPLTHYNPEEVRTAPEAVLEKHRKFGCKYIGLGSMPDMFKENTRETWEKFKKNFMGSAEYFAANGAYLMYHNHAREFVDIDGECAWDYLKREFPASVMGFTVDTHWVDAGGRDILETLEGVKGRIPCVHFKDTVYTEEKERRFAPVGHGVLDFGKIIPKCIDLGVEYAFVEQDNCYGESPFDCFRKSYDYLKSMGLN